MVPIIPIKKQFKHPFHLVDPSPWPLFVSLGLFSLILGFTMYLHSFKEKTFFFISLGLCLTLIAIISWFRDIVREATFEGHHTKAVRKGLKIGMILFIASEVMFFFAFFWAFFHSSLSPVPSIGGVWPPEAIITIYPWGFPLINTIILICSGVTLTWAHRSLVEGCVVTVSNGLFRTLAFAKNFLCYQVYEYQNASFFISDGIYGSLFYLITGFHGFHVIVGFFFLFICYCRLFCRHYTRQHHVGFELATWYWHFVDAVWILVFFIVYWWGS